MEKINLTVVLEDIPCRLDKFIVENVDGITRSHLRKLIDDGQVLLNGSKTKSNYKIKENDQIEVVIPEAVELDVVAEDIPLDIVYQDEDVLVVNKPSGMVVHPAPGHPNGTLVNSILYHVNDLSSINGVVRPGIVHRIDKDTSGLLMVAKNDAAHESLVEQLKEKTVTRRYVALVNGNISHETGTIDAPVGRNTKDRKTMTVTEKNSRNAVTHFKVLERFQKHTLIECVLETGRTHQIRAHMKYIGHPIFGDPSYGPKKSIKPFGQFLHARVLGFEHPRTGEYLEFSAELPEEFETQVNRLRVKNNEE
jgi:23S rRNA pseudouridine1911/1915/1917 synthase